jgi:cellulose synthase/poly-beta-1,6-N-acetylglucosamine synthase-like glycosyltransferase
MLRLFVLAAQLPLLLLPMYNAVISLWGWRDQIPAPEGPRDRPVRVLIPAHDEERVIAGILSDLAAQDYSSPLDVVVIADRCSDGTVAAVGRTARVDERAEGKGGKGAALAWHLDREPVGDREVVVVFDADNRTPSHAISRIVDEIDAGAPAVQCYLDVTNPSGSILATASALSYWASNRMVQLARTNLGWPCDLGGTGMAFTREALVAGGGFTDDLVEDQALGVRLSLAGRYPRWVHSVRIFDEKPTDTRTTVAQRARWQSGRRAVAREMVRPLLHQAIARRSPAMLDLAVRVGQPSRMFLALMVLILGVVSLLTGSSWLLPASWWLIVAAIAVVMPAFFLWRDGVEMRYVLRYPALVLLAALWIPIRVASSFVRTWRPTAHAGGSD